jgi:preprotein translocase subunit YajC
MKKILIIVFATIIATFIACSPNKKNQEAKEKQKQDSIAAADKAIKEADSLVKVIALERTRIENKLISLQKKSLSTTNLRAQIKQKWSEIDFYTENDKIVRIKTLPYKEISNRTEEFYFQKDKLILAYINDIGLQIKDNKFERGTGKTYYYSEDAVIKEENLSGEKETSIRDSDSERLLQEAKEYLTLFPKN